MNVSNVLKLTCLGFAGGTILRLIDMLYFYDYNTGFYMDGGKLAWITMIFMLMISVLCVVMIVRSKSSFGYHRARADKLSGVFAVVSSAAMIIAAVAQLNAYMEHHRLGYVARQFPASSIINMIYVVLTFMFGLVQLFAAFNFFTGKNLFLKFRLLYLISVAWGIVHIVFLFIYYAKSSSVIENMYAIIGGALLLLSFVYVSKLFAGMGGEKTAKTCFAVGIPAIIMNMTYTVSNFVLAVLGNRYDFYGEIPLAMQLVQFGLALFLLFFLFSYGKYNVKTKATIVTEENTKAKKPRNF